LAALPFTKLGPGISGLPRRLVCRKQLLDETQARGPLLVTILSNTLTPEIRVSHNKRSEVANRPRFSVLASASLTFQVSFADGEPR
jgi:hypothetical protein